MRFLAYVVTSAALALLLLSSTASANAPDESAGSGAAAEQASAEHASAEHAGHILQGAPPVNWVNFSYGDKDIYGKKLESGGEPMAPPLVFAFMNFAIFVGLMYWKAGPALTKYLANRHDTIKDALAEAARLQADAKDKLADYSKRIADADAEVTALIEQIRKDAEGERKLIVANAELQAERMRKDAEARIETEFLAARRTLEREVIAKAAETAARLLATKASAADHDSLFSNFIGDLKAGTAAQSQGDRA